MSRYAEALIDLEALAHNLSRLQQIAPHARHLAVVKADAYGHRIAQIAPFLSNRIDAFGVACVDEALTLRALNIKTRIVLLEGFHHVADLPVIIEHGLDLVLHHQFQLDTLLTYLKAQSSTHQLKIWLKFNIGMNRLGWNQAAAMQAWRRLSKTPEIDPDILLIGHFSNAAALDPASMQKQLDQFLQMTASFPGERCLANSAACLNHPTTHFDWVRGGLMLYGVSPFPYRTAWDLDLKPVMHLKSKIIAIRDIQAKETVGYGDTWRATSKTRIGIVSIGYADGYPWRAQTGTPVLIHGQETQILGRISMDMLCVDLSGFEKTSMKVELEDEVLLWGEGLPIERIAQSAGTIPYELLCQIGQRVRFNLKKAD